MRVWYGFMIALFGWSTPMLAQRPDEPLAQELARQFKNRYLSLGVLLQTVADFQPDPPAGQSNGFSIPNFRLLLSGELDAGFGYAFQANLARSPAILDARMYYKVGSNVAVDVGQFKAPFSREFLTYAGNIDFVNRSQVVTALAPGRQLGMQLRVGGIGGVLGFEGGIFNGNGISVSGNDGNGFMVAARFGASGTLARGGSWGVAVNGARSSDRDASFGEGFAQHFSGERSLVGADARWEAGRWLLSGELIWSELSPTPGASRNPWGYHATLGYRVQPFTQLLVRWDAFDPDDNSDRSDLIILGLNFWPTSATEFQINYLVQAQTPEPRRQRLLINFQFGF
ncbi:MAG: hypothetical protein KatS3mg081_2795 [Gemmatimonadales bacterium]|nr:MAG: hypothetical protein KatS3mg081_2795 [Gemmatimonadales bacterium]